MVTMIDVEVDDDWTRTVTSTPSMSSHTGLERISFSAKSDPAARPALVNAKNEILFFNI